METTMQRQSHTQDIVTLRNKAKNDPENKIALECAADLLETHDATGISLDNWDAPRKFVEQYLGKSIYENGA